MRKTILLALSVFCGTSLLTAQTSYYMQGLLRQPNSAAARTYLGVSSLPGSGTVTNFSAGNANPLFTTSVGNPTTDPSLLFTLLFTPFNAANFTAGNITNTLGATPVINALHATTADNITGGLTGVTNAGFPLGSSLISSSNPPVIGLKSLSAGANVSITEVGGTNLQISASSSGGSSSSVDLSQTNMPAYDGATNFYLDFNWPAQVLSATGSIVFNYSTNWGLNATSRVVRVYIAPTNYFRRVYFVNAATNWHEQVRPLYGIPDGYGAKVEFQVFGQGDTNVVYTSRIDDHVTGTNYLTVNGFNPTNSQGGCVLWLEASTGTYQEETGNTPCIPGVPVRWWTDLSGFVPRMTNNANGDQVLLTTPNSTPRNVPALHWAAGASWFTCPVFTALAQPNWAFILYYGRANSATFLDGNAEGNRFAATVGQGPQAIQVYSGTSLFAPAQSPNYEWRLYAFEQNSTSSVIRTNGVQTVSGNSGTQTPSRWVIGGDYNEAAFNCDAYVAEVLIYHTNLSNLQVTNIENYFKAKYQFP